MKKLSSLLFAAILGSGLTLGVYHYADLGSSKTVKIEHVNDTPTISASNINSTYDGVAALNFTDAAEKVMPAVVHIQSTRTSDYSNQRGEVPPQFREFFGPFFREDRGGRSRPQVGTGSGVIISGDGYIVTNNHVIDEAEDIEVTLFDNRSYKATVIGTDPSTDLALIQIKEKGLPFLSFTDSDNSKVGEWVLAVGNPFNLNSTVTAGIISAKARNINILGNSAIESFIQTDAAVNPGNSGGALVDLNGNLIGINTAIASPTGSYSGYSFAVPSKIVSKVVEDLLEYGVVQRGWLGVQIRSVDSNLAKEEDLNVNSGVYVDSIMVNSGAGEAGIKVGDVITAIDGEEVRSNPELIGNIGSHSPGDKITLTVNRKGNVKDYVVTLKNRDGNEQVIARAEKTILDELGAEFGEVDDKVLRKLDLNGGVQIKSLKSGKLAKQTDIREGFIITKVGDKSVKSVKDLQKILENVEGGVLIEGVYEDYPGVHYFGIGM
ncbi:MAG: Do family serine endopeptidase [Bacteroidota bacterium]